MIEVFVRMFVMGMIVVSMVVASLIRIVFGIQVVVCRLSVVPGVLKLSLRGWIVRVLPLLQTMERQQFRWFHVLEGNRIGMHDVGSRRHAENRLGPTRRVVAHRA